MSEMMLRRLFVAIAAGLIGVLGGYVAWLLGHAVRRVDPRIPFVAGAAVGVTVFVIDWLTERR